MVSRLVGVRESAHAWHYAENVVVRRIDIDRWGRERANRVVRDREEQRGVVNAWQVARAARLVLLRLEREGIHVDADRRHVRVVLVRLHQVEVVAAADLETVVAVELEQGRDDRVGASHALNTRDGVARLQDWPVPPVREVERLLALPRVDDVRVAARVGVALDNPEKLLARVVEVQLELVAWGRYGLAARELQGLNEVLVADLGELTTLIRVQVDVIHIEGRRDEAAVANTRVDGGRGGRLRWVGPHEIVKGVELEVDADLVVLERDERQRKARVTAEPELQRDVERVLRGAVDNLVPRVRLTASAVIVARLAALYEEVRELGDVAHHLRVAGLLASLLRKLIPDVQPLAIVLVNALAADLEFNPVNKVVTNPVEPAELGARAVRRQQGDWGERGLEVHTVDQVTVALDRARDLLAEVRRAVPRVLNGLHGEVRVATVHHLEKGNLRVTRQIDVLRTIGDELHQTTTCHFSLYPFKRKKICQNYENA